jgi:ankyrin repeat protein
MMKSRTIRIRSDADARWKLLLLLLCFPILLTAAPRDLTLSSDSPVADAAMANDGNAVRALLKEGADVNAAQGDGMTALHWSALKGNDDLAQMLLYAGAYVEAKTRVSAYTPLHLASKGGHASMVHTLLGSGAEATAVTTTGATTLMFAAMAGDVETTNALLDHGVDVNATESSSGQTALMFAAAYGRANLIPLLTAVGADVEASTEIVDVPEKEKKSRAALRARLLKIREERQKAAAEKEDDGSPGGEGEGPETAEVRDEKTGGGVFSKMFGWLPFVKGGASEVKEGTPARRRFRRTSYGELVSLQGGMTALLFAARQGNLDAVEALVEAGADVNQMSSANDTSPLLIATMNGRYDVAARLTELGADPNLAAKPSGVTPLYATINNWYAPHTSHPQPRAQLQQKLSHLDLLKALLEKGADPNVRLQQKIWFSAYNFDQSGIDETGATPFWRAAYGSDVAAMKLLVSYGADPNVATKKPPERPRVADQDGREIQDVSGIPPVPVGGPALYPIHAASGAGYGEGFAANEHRNHPAGWLPAMRYLVEETGADVNARDHEGNTPLHNAAARGDVEMIEYLVSKGADPTAVNREGQTTADMANGPVQRIQPFPDAIERLVSLGAVNNNRCVSC